MTIYNNHVIISEITLENSDDELYEVTFHGKAEDYGYDNETDYLSAVDAEEIAKEVAEEMGSIIAWDCIKPSNSYTGISL